MTNFKEKLEKYNNLKQEKEDIISAKSNIKQIRRNIKGFTNNTVINDSALSKLMDSSFQVIATFDERLMEIGVEIKEIEES